MKNLVKTLRNRKVGIFLLLPVLILIISAMQLNEPLNGLEKEGLVYTVEEARLTRDVNTFLYAKWDEPVFDYVLAQENDNIYRMQKLIKKHGGFNPIAFSMEGRFNIPALQKDYNTYVNIGKNNLTAAFYVSMTLEERNYLNMQTRISEAENLDLIKVYSKRMELTGNHIRVLFKNLKRMNVDYKAQFMDNNEFLDLINADNFLESISM